MNGKLISIIVPLYNAEKKLEECIYYIRKQTHVNLEIIFINDGSTDSSGEILDNHRQEDYRIKIINQENKGVSEARNLGLSVATGEFVLFVDSDDWISEDTCEKALSAILQYDADVVMWPYIREYATSSKPTYLFDEEIKIFENQEMKSLYRRMVGPIKEELRNPEKLDSLGTIWGKLYRRSLILDEKFIDTKLIGTGEDVLFNIMLFAKVKKAVYISEIFYHYRKDDLESLSHRYKKNLAVQWLRLYSIIQENLEESNKTQEFFEALSNRICLGFIGLGLNLAEDTRISFGKKVHELKRILNIPHYKNALQELKLKFFPFYWKFFWKLAQKKCAFCLCMLLHIMDKMRKL